jgi:hypothetical protein
VATGTIAGQLPSGFSIPRWPQDDDELYYFIQAIWGVRIPRYVYCPNHVAPFTAFANAFFARDRLAIWKASRGFGGKTMTLSCLVNTEAVCLGADSSILGGSAAQSLNVHASSVGMWHHHMAPRFLLRQEPTKYDTFLNNGAYIRSLMASQTSVRGPHPQRLRMDEIDEMDLPILEAALGQPMSKQKIHGRVQPQTVLSSTHQYPDGTMSEMLKRAPLKGWSIYEWCYKESANPIDGWLTVEEIESQKTVIPKAMWDAEYDLQEPSFEGRAFDVDAIEEAFDRRISIDVMSWRLEDEVDGNGDPLYTVDTNLPIYVTGVDWAKERDWTVVMTFDAKHDPWHCVEVQIFQRIPWPNAVLRAENQYKHYGGPRGGVFAHDATGLGDVIDDYFDPQLRKRRKFLPVIMGAGRARHEMFSEYIAAIEGQKIHYPRLEVVYNQHKFCVNEDLFGKGHPPDSVVSGSIAWAARALIYGGSVPAPKGFSRETSPWDLGAAQPV